LPAGKREGLFYRERMTRQTGAGPFFGNWVFLKYAIVLVLTVFWIEYEYEHDPSSQESLAGASAFAKAMADK
jgi:hypothetical protein